MCPSACSGRISADRHDSILSAQKTLQDGRQAKVSSCAALHKRWRRLLAVPIWTMPCHGRKAGASQVSGEKFGGRTADRARPETVRESDIAPGGTGRKATARDSLLPSTGGLLDSVARFFHAQNGLVGGIAAPGR